MKLRWGIEKLGKGPEEDAMSVAAEAGSSRKSFMGEAGESIRGVILLPVSMILLLFDLLDGQHRTRP